MSDIKFVAIISATNSQDGFPAANLLSHESYKKWKCTPGTKQAVVILKMDLEHCIESVDIGNEGSCFIEVQVGRSADEDVDSYQVLVMTSNYMSPAESKVWTNLNVVKLFSKDLMNKVVCDQKWDRVKIVCTQPYNTSQPYGLSFVRMKTTFENVTDSATFASTLLRGDSLVKVNSESQSVLPPGSLFFKKKAIEKLPSEPSMTAKAKQACTNLIEDEPNAKKLKLSPQQEVNTNSSDIMNVNKAKFNSSKPENKVTKTDYQNPKTENKENVKITFGSILKGVTFALSGYKNPKRGELRDKAVEMGGIYESDWSAKCTHLVCAFKNTPKFRQVVSKKTSCIVGDKWITECYMQKKRVSAENFLLSSLPEPSKSFDNVSNITPGKFDSKSTDNNKINKTKNSKIEEISSTQVKKSPAKEQLTSKPNFGKKYGATTEDEPEIKDIDIADYDASTEEEPDTDDTKNSPNLATNLDLLNLPNFLSDYIILLYGDFAKVDDEKLIKRYLTAYGACIVGYMSDKVTHVVTSSPWDENFDDALENNAKLQFVKPQWVFECHNKQKLVPYQHFNITP